MAGKAKPLKGFLSIKLEDGSIVPWDSLSAERREYCERKMLENASRHMSMYYAEHPEEYEKLESL